MEIFLKALMIFMLRLADQSIGTMRSLLVNKNKPFIAAFLGFIESAIWIFAITKVIKDVNEPILIAAYAAGFASGTILGSYIERLIGVGNVAVRVFCPVNSPSIAETLRENGYGVTVIEGQGKDGPVKIYWCIIPRRKYKSVLSIIKKINPNVYVTADMSNPIAIKNKRK